MDEGIVAELVAELTVQHFGDVAVAREPVRAWQMSAVERLRPADGDTVIFKAARTPFTSEPRVLAHAARHGVRAPRLLAVAHRPGLVGMLLQDLGPVHREPTLAEAAAAAAATHAVPGMDEVEVLDAAGLSELPKRALSGLTDLTTAGRWTAVDDIADGLHVLADAAATTAQGAELAPFGLCHSEFHPTSLHVDADEQARLLDWARAFTGPGLLDLISWQGTTHAPDLAAFHALLDAYLAAGGPAEARADRGGLPVEQWSVLWHRTWIIEWYLSQATTWIDDPATDATYQRVIRRHLGEALACLMPTP